MPRNTTTYRFSLPDGQTYGGASVEFIFATHPAAIVTHRIDWDATGRGHEVKLPAALTIAAADFDAVSDQVAGDALSGLIADLEDELGDGYVIYDTDDRESMADGDADEGSAGEWGD